MQNHALLGHYIDCFREKIDCETLNKHHIHHNLSTAERTAVQSWKSKDQTAIKSADKGGAIVILNCDDYVNEANRQPSNTTDYKELRDDSIPEFTQKKKLVP
ncbi:hypothetical protein UY3_16281 [Chelonia mydas]|uniref:Uncharacterized protein n=1 Tax=Chelonia mydas TaxID=8469 RepID=M7APW0_CHEMY|nr:hypothetical protein UY3_16281 [Chelonia mydas]